MTTKKMSGFVDPFSLGLLIALAGSALGVIETEPTDAPVAVSVPASPVQAQDSKAEAPAAESVSTARAE
jgi:hypothetical protein